jgi:radical SAM protein with 4Fe4S-binding SPASM domain
MPVTESGSRLTAQVTDSYINVFEEILKQLISNIFDTRKPFTQTEKTEDCKYCPFKTICNRS